VREAQHVDADLRRHDLHKLIECIYYMRQNRKRLRNQRSSFEDADEPE